MPDFQQLPLWGNLAAFFAAAVAVWIAGTRLAQQVDEIGERTGLGEALLGLLLLGVATSLPEIATTISGAAIGNAQLVAGNLFGGVALQIAVLAIVDMIAVRGALTYFTPQPVLLFQGVMLLLLLSVALAGAATGEPLGWGGVGLTPVLLLGGYLLTLRVIQGGKYLPRWRATHAPESRDGSQPAAEEFERISDARLYSYAAIAAGVISPPAG